MQFFYYLYTQLSLFGLIHIYNLTSLISMVFLASIKKVSSLTYKSLQSGAKILYICLEFLIVGSESTTDNYIWLHFQVMIYSFCYQRLAHRG